MHQILGSGGVRCHRNILCSNLHTHYCHGKLLSKQRQIELVRSGYGRMHPIFSNN